MVRRLADPSQDFRFATDVHEPQQPPPETEPLLPRRPPTYSTSLDVEPFPGESSYLFLSHGPHSPRHEVLRT